MVGEDNYRAGAVWREEDTKVSDNTDRALWEEDEGCLCQETYAGIRSFCGVIP